MKKKEAKKKKKPAPTHSIVRSLSVGNGTTYQLRMVDCGKHTKCRKGCAGGKPSHGPYWYSVAWNPETGRAKTSYLGKKEPSISEIADRMTGATP
jgi:hypothetical protein